MHQDDPTKCTASKLLRAGMLRQLWRQSMIPYNALVLNPSAEVLTKNDKQYLRSGIVVIDCSWKRANEVFGKRFRGKNRRLPMLLAANPTNYGLLYTLSSVEALSAALVMLGFLSEAEKLLSKFKWGQTFLDLNVNALEDYSKAENAEAIAALEMEYFPRAQ